jgi:hypothetical protein
LDNRIGLNGAISLIVVSLHKKELVQIDSEVIFKFKDTEIVCALKNTEEAIGNVERFENINRIQFLIESGRFYWAHITQVNGEYAVIQLNQPQNYIKELGNFYINSSKSTERVEILNKRYLLDMNKIFVHFNEEKNKFYIFGDRSFKYSEIAWKDDQLFLVKELYSEKMYAKLIQNAIVFQTNVIFSNSVDTNKEGYEMTSLITYFNRSSHYLKEWSRYLKYEENFIKEQVKACSHLQYRHLQYLPLQFVST